MFRCNICPTGKLNCFVSRAAAESHVMEKIPALDGNVHIVLMLLLDRMVSMGYALEERDHCCQNAAIGVRVKLEKMQGGRTLNTKIMTPRAKYK